MKSITIGKTDKLCDKCGNRMIVKGHQPDDIHIHKQKQYYTQWNYCYTCKTIWYELEYLVINSKRKSEIQEYYSEIDSLFKNI